MSDKQVAGGARVADGATALERPNPSEAVIPMLQSSRRTTGAGGPRARASALLELKEEAGKWNAAELVVDGEGSGPR